MFIGRDSVWYPSCWGKWPKKWFPSSWYESLMTIYKKTKTEIFCCLHRRHVIYILCESMPDPPLPDIVRFGPWPLVFVLGSTFAAPKTRLTWWQTVLHTCPDSGHSAFDVGYHRVVIFYHFERVKSVKRTCWLTVVNAKLKDETPQIL